MFFEARAQVARKNKIAWTRKSPGVCFIDTNLDSYPFVGTIISDLLDIVKFAWAAPFDTNPVCWYNYRR